MPDPHLAAPESIAKLDPRLVALVKMDPEARRALHADERARLAELATELRRVKAEARTADKEGRVRILDITAALRARFFVPFTAGISEQASSPGAAPDTLLSAFIVATASAKQLGELGATIRSQAEDLFTAFIPMAALPALVASPLVTYVELANGLLPDMNDACRIAQIDQLHRPPSNVRGKGVIVAIIDSTLDLYCPDFLDPTDKTTRVLYLWDQGLTAVAGEHSPSGAPYAGNAPTPSYGVEYDKAHIDAQLANGSPPNAYALVRHNALGEEGSHGTAVTAIAAGNGSEHTQSGVAYVGAAPEASLIFIANRSADSSGIYADITQVIDGFVYAFERANQLNMACVVNMSNGSNLGAHDGSTIAERFMDRLLSQPGRAITLSAGNSTGTQAHASGTIARQQQKRITIDCKQGAVNSNAIELWYEHSDRFMLTLEVGAARAGPIAPNVSAAPIPLPNGCVLHVSSRLNWPGNGRNCITILCLVPPGASIPVGPVTLILKPTALASGKFHAWIDRNNRGFVTFTSDIDEKSVTLGTPGTARSAITVGNHTKGAPPAIAGDSGLGPTLDGRTKPEVAAVGTDVFTVYSHDRNQASYPVSWNYDTFDGTSASAPVVAGACACIFECRGRQMTCAELKQILEAMALPAGTPPGRNNSFGYGYLQVASGCTLPQATFSFGGVIHGRGRVPA